MVVRLFRCRVRVIPLQTVPFGSGRAFCVHAVRLYMQHGTWLYGFKFWFLRLLQLYGAWHIALPRRDSRPPRVPCPGGIYLRSVRWPSNMQSSLNFVSGVPTTVIHGRARHDRLPA